MFVAQRPKINPLLRSARANLCRDTMRRQNIRDDSATDSAIEYDSEMP